MRRRVCGCGLAARLGRDHPIRGLMAKVDEDQHLYQDCADDYCMRFGCRAYKTGRVDEHDPAYDQGYADGFGAGFAAGLTAAGGAK